MGYPTAPAVREVSHTPYGSDAVDGSAAGDGSDTGDGSAAGDGSGEALAPDIDPSDLDAVDDLGDEIVTLAAHIHAATARILLLIARFDRVEGWKRGGHRSCARWLAYRTGLDLGTAREHVRVARALEHLPKTSAAMAQGALSFSQVRALTRVAEPETEADLLALAEGMTAAHLERVVRASRRGGRKDEAEWKRERHRSRALSVFPDEEGMYVVKGRLDPEVGALLMRAVEAASDALYREKRADRLAAALAEAEGLEAAGGSHPSVGRDAHREAARRRADAVGLVAERALAAGFGAAGGESEDDSDHPCACGSSASEVPISGTRAERYQVVLHVEPATLRAEEGRPKRSRRTGRTPKAFQLKRPGGQGRVDGREPETGGRGTRWRRCPRTRWPRSLRTPWLPSFPRTGPGAPSPTPTPPRPAARPSATYRTTSSSGRPRRSCRHGGWSGGWWPAYRPIAGPLKKRVMPPSSLPVSGSRRVTRLFTISQHDSHFSGRIRS